MRYVIISCLLFMSTAAAEPPPFPIVDGPLFGSPTSVENSWSDANALTNYLNSKAAESRVDSAIKESNWILNGPDLLPPQNDLPGQATNEAVSRMVREFQLQRALQERR